MEKLSLIFLISWGCVLWGNVVEVSTTQPEWDNQQFLEGLQSWYASYQQQSASTNENGKGVGDQTTLDPINSLVSAVVQEFVPTRDNKTNSYDLRETMEFFNRSYGFPTVDDNNTTHNGPDDQVSAFSAMFNAGMNALFKPDSIPNYLNLLRNASDTSVDANGDALNTEAIRKQFEMEYEVYRARFIEALRSNKTSNTLDASQNQINDVVSNINSQLSQFLKLPENATGINMYWNQGGQK